MKLKDISKEIAILPPFKEHFSNKSFGSVSLYIRDINKKSKFKKTVNVYHNYIGPSYPGFKTVNLPRSLNHLIFGKNIGHTKSFIKYLKNNNKYPQIIEVHNRPKSAYLISTKINLSKIFLFYHNDPLSFKDSSSLHFRKELLNRCYKICFVSNFLKKRFMQDIPLTTVTKKKLHVIYNGVEPLVNKATRNKKIENIVYVGELTKNKGFDIFLDAVVEIKSNFSKWQIDIFGKNHIKYSKDLNRYKNIKFHGFVNHDHVLQFLNKSSISVIPSVWDEPFGRTLVESINANVATISSTNGGLKEICKHFKVIKLNKINKKCIYNAIKKLIMSDHERTLYSDNNVSNSPFTLKKITSNLDLLRSKAIS